MVSFFEISSSCPPSRLKFILGINGNLERVQSAYQENPEAWTLDLCQSFLVCDNLSPPKPGVLKFLFDKLPPPDFSVWCELHQFLNWRIAGDGPAEDEVERIVEFIFNYFDTQSPSWKRQEHLFEKKIEKAFGNLLWHVMESGRYSQRLTYRVCFLVASRSRKLVLTKHTLTIDEKRHHGILAFFDNPRITSMSISAQWHSEYLLDILRRLLRSPVCKYLYFGTRGQTVLTRHEVLEQSNHLIQSLAQLPYKSHCSIETFHLKLYDEVHELFDGYISLSNKMKNLMILRIELPGRWRDVIPSLQRVFTCNKTISSFSIIGLDLEQEDWHVFLKDCSEPLAKRETGAKLCLCAGHHNADNFKFPVDLAASIMEQNQANEIEFWVKVGANGSRRVENTRLNRLCKRNHPYRVQKFKHSRAADINANASPFGFQSNSPERQTVSSNRPYASSGSHSTRRSNLNPVLPPLPMTTSNRSSALPPLPAAASSQSVGLDRSRPVPSWNLNCRPLSTTSSNRFSSRVGSQRVGGKVSPATKAVPRKSLAKRTRTLTECISTWVPKEEKNDYEHHDAEWLALVEAINSLTFDESQSTE